LHTNVNDSVNDSINDNDIINAYRYHHPADSAADGRL
jgi:hypothetical protein